jgi:hypothetical protein
MTRINFTIKELENLNAICDFYIAISRMQIENLDRNDTIRRIYGKICTTSDFRQKLFEVKASLGFDKDESLSLDDDRICLTTKFAKELKDKIPTIKSRFNVEFTSDTPFSGHRVYTKEFLDSRVDEYQKFKLGGLDASDAKAIMLASKINPLKERLDLYFNLIKVAASKGDFKVKLDHEIDDDLIESLQSLGFHVENSCNDDYAKYPTHISWA